MSEKMPRMENLKNASAETGLSYNYLRQLCLQNTVANIRVGVKYLINMDRLADFLNGVQR